MCYSVRKNCKETMAGQGSQRRVGVSQTKGEEEKLLEERPVYAKVVCQERNLWLLEPEWRGEKGRTKRERSTEATSDRGVMWQEAALS